MKLQKIKISSFRGIPDDFERELNCKSLVIVGDNGTGKSGLIDAVDFLLTGKIKRLSGEGTGNISQEKYGHHIDKTAQEAKVEAVVEFKGKNLTIQRNLNQHKKIVKLKGEEETFVDLENFLEKGQFSLSRRELLKFIICTDQDRSKAIQELLDISEIDRVRTAITQSYNKMEGEKNSLDKNIKLEILNLKRELELEDSSQTNDMRERINEYRKKLKVEKITQWDQNTNILEGIHLEKTYSNMSLTKNKFEKDTGFLTQEDDALRKEKTTLIEIINKILKIESFEELTKTNNLIELGMDLLTDNTCPLCDTEWKEKDLIGYLKDKLQKASKAIQLKKEFQTFSKRIIVFLEEYLSNLQNVQAISADIFQDGNNELKKELEVSINFTRNRIKLYENTLNKKDLLSVIEKEINIIDLPNWDSLKKAINIFLKNLPEESEEEKIYKTLVSARDRRNRIKDYKIKLQKNNFNLVGKIKQHFENRTSIFFKNLYEEIENDFVTYYKYLNEDELSFSASIKEQKGSVDLKVDFYKRGVHPPHALHSEGHQDSMGICLFLALMKKIKGNNFSIALLDDVMMSVDIGHRRKLAQLLKDKFSNTQFLITTHDPIWAKELKKLNIVSKDNKLKFSNWSPDGGPSYRIDDPWTHCENYTEKGDVKLAAKILREALEEEFQEFCFNLRAKVPFNSDANWTLSELLDGALSAFKDNLKKAASDNQENLNKIKEIETKLDSAKQKADIDQWILNPLNHYNKWATFSKEELKNLIKNMKSFCSAFSFKGAPFIISVDGNRKPVALTALHENMYFALIKKQPQRDIN